MDTHLINLTTTVASSPQADHAKGSREAQRTEKDILAAIISADLLKNVKAKFGVCRNERVHCETSNSLKLKESWKN